MKIIKKSIHCQQKSIQMSETHNTCQFTRCLRHLRPECSIRFSPKLGLYLCAQHEKVIVKDHMRQFYEAQIRNRNIPFGSPLPTYNTLSLQIRNTLTNLQYLPIELPINQCLYKFNIRWSIFNTLNVDCTMYIKNDENLIQLGSHRNAEIQKFFSYSTRLFTHEELMYNNMDIFFSNINMNTSVYDINIPVEITRPRMDELLLQFQAGRNQSSYTYESEEDNTNQQIQQPHVISRNISPVPADDDEEEVLSNNEEEIHDYLHDRPVWGFHGVSREIDDEISISPPVNVNRLWSGIPGIRRRIQDTGRDIGRQISDTRLLLLELKTIDFCHICVSEEIQKGFHMSCCNVENKVCITCVISHQLLEKSNYVSFLDIDTNILKDKQPCFFCRQSNSIERIMDDNECKEKFIELLQVNIRQELKQQEEEHIARVRSSIGL